MHRALLFAGAARGAGPEHVGVDDVRHEIDRLRDDFGKRDRVLRIDRLVVPVPVVVVRRDRGRRVPS